MSVSTPEEFYAHLVRCRLLSREALRAVRDFLSQPGRPAVVKVAQWMVQQGYLTVWQAERLLMGKRQFYLGKYKFLEPIAEGAMGVVFKAEHGVMGRTVALKVLSKARLSHPNAVSRFEREVQAAAALNHPNIVTAFDAGQVGNTHFLVMEYIQGADLNTWQEKYKKVPIPWACEFIRQAALGLAHAHAQGLVHRDIKPANIMVAWNERDNKPVVKILDLGLARVLDEEEEAPSSSDDTGFLLNETAESQLTQFGAILGTPDYLSPEQILHNTEVDARTDIFSLGCTLFKIMTGHLPYGGPNLIGKLQARVSPTAPPAVKLRTVLPDAGAALEAVIDRMVEREPAKRFPSASDVAAALAPFARAPNEPWETYRPVVPERDSEEVGSSQMILDPRLRQFLDELGGEASDSAPAEEDHRVTRSMERRSVLDDLKAVAASASASGIGSRKRLPSVGAGTAALAGGPLGLPVSESPFLPPPLLDVRAWVRRHRRARWPWVVLLLACLAGLAWPVYSHLRSMASIPTSSNNGQSNTAIGNGGAAANGNTAKEYAANDKALAFLWHGTKCANEIQDATSGAGRACTVSPRHDIRPDDEGRMFCSGAGYFQADETSAGQFRELCGKSNEFSLELVLTPEKTQSGAMLVFGDERGWNLKLEQLDDHLALWLRTADRSDWKARLSGITAGVPVHVVVSFRAGKLICVTDGNASATSVMEAPRGRLDVWTKGPLTFGDKSNRSAPWHGVISSAVLRGRFVDAAEAARLFEAARRRGQL